MKKSDESPAITENVQLQLKALEEDRKKIRFQHSLSIFIEGDYRILLNDEFVQGLSFSFRKESFTEEETLNEILDALMGAVLCEDVNCRQRALPVVYQAANFFINMGHRNGVLCILAIMMEWVRSESEVYPGGEPIAKRIEESMQWLLDRGDYSELETGLTVLYKIRNGEIYNTPTMKAMLAKTVREIATDINLEKLVDLYIHSRELKETYLKILIALNPDSVFFILDQVLQNDNKNQRLVLVKLLSEFGEEAASALVTALESQPSWSVVRNIILVLGEIGNPDYYRYISDYHSFPDERVQLESISATIKMGGEEKRTRLIDAMLLVNERLKLYILRVLLEEQTQDHDLYEGLKALIEQRATFSYSVGTQLLSSIITSLKKYPSIETVGILHQMREDYVKGADVGQVVLLIDEAVNFIEPKIRHGSQNIGSRDDEAIIFDNDPAQQQLSANLLKNIDANVQKHIRVGDMKGASAYIYEQAIAATHQGNFNIAEVLRDRLLEVNPLALTEVVKIGEVIDGQRTVSITPHHIEIWQELYDRMTTKQFNALYYNSINESYRKDELIVKSGETDKCLYFLNSGTISMVCHSGDNEIFLRKMNPGDIIGAEQFFSASVWTVTLRAFSEVQLHVIDQDGWKKILDEAPEIEEKLEMYCQRYEKVADLVKMSGDDRRTESRHAIQIKSRHILLDPFGKRGKRSFGGELIDLSRTGIAFTIKMSNQKIANTLLGRQILSYLEMDGAVYPEFAGVVVGVRVHDAMAQKYSVHVKLANIIHDVQFRQIIRSAR